MNDISREIRAELKGLNTICANNDLQFKFKITRLPVRFIIRPSDEAVASALDNALFSEKELPIVKPIIAPDAMIEFSFVPGGIIVETHSKFVIDDDVLNKIKGKAKKLHYLMLQLHFHNEMQKVADFEYIVDAEDDPFVIFA